MDGGSMALFIAVWAGIGFSVIATGVADNKMDKKARLQGVALNPEDRFKTLILVALASAIVFAVITYKALQ
jgi:hypothetical protein